MIAQALRKTLARVPALAALVKSGPLQHLVQTLRGAKVVREPLRFMALQLKPARAGAPARATAHRLRESDLVVFLRHRTRDVHIFNEIFGGTGGRRSYEPPPAVATRLDAVRAPRIIDLGANIGLFGAYALGRWPDAAVRSFEPDPTNVHVLTRLIVANGLQRRWSVAEVAVANRAGELSFAAGLFADSHLELVGGLDDARVPTPGHGSRVVTSGRDAGQLVAVRAVDIFEEDHDADLMKIDIEGGEWAILTDPRLAGLGAGVLVLEWHAQGCPEPDAHASALRLLGAAGYDRIEEVERGRDNGLLWAWRDQPGSGSQLASGSRGSGQARHRQAVPAEHAGAVLERRDPALGAHA